MSMLYTQLFRGPVGVSLYPSWNFEEVFKLQNVTAEPTTTEITIADPTRIGLPPLDSLTSTSEIILNGEAVAFSPAAAAIAMYGTVSQVPAGSVTEEEHPAYVDRTIMLAHVPLEVTAVTDDAGTTTYLRNIDYAVTPAGIRVLLGGDLAADIAASSEQMLPVKISYSYPEVDVVKPFVEGQKYYRVLLSQVNEAGNNEKRRIQCFYCRIALNGGIPLNQGAEFGVIPVQIRLLADPAIVDVGEAAMWQWEVERKAA